MNIKDLRKLKVVELEKKIDELTEKLEKKQFEVSNGNDKNTAGFKLDKRELAKVKTVLNEQKLISELKSK